MTSKHRINLKNSLWIDVEETRRGLFTVVDDNIRNGDRTALGLKSRSRSGEVTDLDAGQSDGSLCFGISSHMLWQDVDLTPDQFRAPSLDRLKEALRHVEIFAWCPEDV